MDDQLITREELFRLATGYPSIQSRTHFFIQPNLVYDRSLFTWTSLEVDDQMITTDFFHLTGFACGIIAKSPKICSTGQLPDIRCRISKIIEPETFFRKYTTDPNRGLTSAKAKVRWTYQCEKSRISNRIWFIFCKTLFLCFQCNILRIISQMFAGLTR